jgi:hypothetical protein
VPHVRYLVDAGGCPALGCSGLPRDDGAALEQGYGHHHPDYQEGAARALGGHGKKHRE